MASCQARVPFVVCAFICIAPMSLSSQTAYAQDLELTRDEQRTLGVLDDFDNAFLYDESALEIAGGEVTFDVVVFDNSLFRLSFGSVGDDVGAYGHSVFEMTGGILSGTVGDDVFLSENASFTMDAGIIGDDLFMHVNSVATVNGGEVLGNAWLYDSSVLMVQAAAQPPRGTLEGTSLGIGLRSNRVRDSATGVRLSAGSSSSFGESASQRGSLWVLGDAATGGAFADGISNVQLSGGAIGNDGFGVYRQASLRVSGSVATVLQPNAFVNAEDGVMHLDAGAVQQPLNLDRSVLINRGIELPGVLYAYDNSAVYLLGGSASVCQAYDDAVVQQRFGSSVNFGGAQDGGLYWFAGGEINSLGSHGAGAVAVIEASRFELRVFNEIEDEYEWQLLDLGSDGILVYQWQPGASNSRRFRVDQAGITQEVPTSLTEGGRLELRRTQHLGPVTGDVTWSSSTGGLFTDPLKWDPGVVPGENNSIVLDAPGEGLYSVVLEGDTAARSVRSLDEAPVIDLQSYDLLLDRWLRVDGEVLNVVNSHPLRFGQSGLVDVSRIEVEAIQGAGELRLHRAVEVRSPAQSLTVSTGSTINLASLSHDPYGREPHVPKLRAPEVVIAGGAALRADADGHVDGNLVNQGTVTMRRSPNGGAPVTLTVDGNYTQSPAAVLEVDIDAEGWHRGTKLQVNGTATLEGTLRIRRPAFQSASPGDSFTIIEAEELVLADGLGFELFDGVIEGDEIETPGVLNTGNQAVFWGIDYNRRNDGRHTVDLVALRVPLQIRDGFVGSDGSVFGSFNRWFGPSQGQQVDHLILVSHGTSHYFDSNPNALDDPIGRLAFGMSALAEWAGVADRTVVLAVDWREFATNPTTVTESGPLSSWRPCFWVPRIDQCPLGCDTKDRPFDPFETARFAEFYAESLLRYFAAEGVWEEQFATKRRLNVGGLQSIHALGHSSGAYVADGLLDILADDRRSPYGNDRPAKTHLTLLDAYLPPQLTGDVAYDENCLVVPDQDFTGPDIVDDLANNVDAVDHYFNLESWPCTPMVPGTDNDPPLTAVEVFNIEVTLFPTAARGFCSGHSFPVQYYVDSIAQIVSGSSATRIDTPLRVNGPAILRAYGAAFAPVLEQTEAWRSLSAAKAEAESLGDEYTKDDDLDLVTRVPIGNSNFVRIGLFQIGEGVETIPDGATFRIELPNRSGTHFAQALPSDAFLSYDFESSSLGTDLSLVVTPRSGAGTLRVIVDDVQVGQVDTGEIAEGSAIFTFSLVPLSVPDIRNITIRFSTLDTSVPAEVDVTEVTLLEQIYFAAGRPLCAVDIAGVAGPEPDGQATAEDIVAFLVLVNAADLSADLNQDGVVNFTDVLVYLNLFELGCPELGALPSTETQPNRHKASLEQFDP